MSIHTPAPTGPDVVFDGAQFVAYANGVRLDAYENSQHAWQCARAAAFAPVQPTAPTDTLDTITERWLQQVEIDQTLPPVTVELHTPPVDDDEAVPFIKYTAEDVSFFVDNPKLFSFDVHDGVTPAVLRALIALCSDPRVQQWAGLTSGMVHSEQGSYPADADRPQPDHFMRYACGKGVLKVFDDGAMLFSYDDMATDITAADLGDLRALLGLPDIEAVAAIEFYQQGWKEGREALLKQASEHFAKREAGEQ